MNLFQTLDGNVSAFSATNELLKVAVSKRKSSRTTRKCRLFCFHSWRSALQGMDQPLDIEELAFAQQHDPPLLHLVTTHNHKIWIGDQLGHNAMLLPLTSLQDETIYSDLELESDFDVFFSCMFTDAHIARKRVDLLFRLLELAPDLRVAWVGGYDPYERWAMEASLNGHYLEHGPPGPHAEPNWSESESSLCWTLGGGVFDDEVTKQSRMRQMVERSLKRGFRIQFYPNLGREQVVHLLNRCRTSLCLSVNDLWPRSLTEAMACGTPAVAVEELMCGLDAIKPETGVRVNATPESILDGIFRAGQLVRRHVRSCYFESYGLRNGISRLTEVASTIEPNWTDIVTVERPSESKFKRSLRDQMASFDIEGR